MDNGIIKVNGFVNDFMEEVGYINIREISSATAPEYTPDEIAYVFNEAATCVAVECWNAAGAMFRTAIDLSTKSFLPEDDTAPPPKRVRRSLGLRLGWLFDNNLLPGELKELADAVQQDGNDGVHDATLTKADALDLMDFTQQLLNRLYTVPGRIKAAKDRREERRSQQ